MKDLLILFGLAFVPVVALFIGLWRSARGRARRAEKLVTELALAPKMRSEAGSETDLTRIRNALEALALDVDHLAEAQRFTAQILNERREAGAPPMVRFPRSITPH